MSKVYKWLAIILGALFILVLVLVLFVRFYLTGELLAAWITPPLEHYLHRDVSLTDARIGFRGFCVDGLEIRKEGAGDPLVKGERLELRWKFKELLKGRVVIHTLAFTKPEIIVIRHKDGSLSIADLLPEKTSSDEDVSSHNTAGHDHGGVPLLITLFSLENGRLTFVDRSRQPQATFIVNNIQSRIMDFSTTTPIPFEIEGQIEGADLGYFVLSGTYDFVKSAFKGDVNLQEIDLANLVPLLAEDHADTIQQGKLSLEAALAVEGFDHLVGKGKLNLNDLKIKKDEKLSKDLQVDANFQLDAVRSQQNLKIVALDLVINGQKAQIQGILTQWHQRPQFDFTLSSHQIKLDELLTLLPKSSPPAEKTVSDSNQSPTKNELPADKGEQEPGAEPASLSALNKPVKQPGETADSSQANPKSEITADQAGTTSVVRAKKGTNTDDKLTLKGSGSRSNSIALDARGEIHLDWFLYNKLVVSNVDCQLLLQDGKLQVEPLSASLYGGALGGSVKGDLESAGPPFQSRVYTENVLLDEIIAAFWSDTSGRWSGNVNLISRLSGNGSDLSAFESRTDLNINDAEFSEHPLFLQLADLFQAENLKQLRFSQVTARILTHQGVATLKRLHLMGPIVQAEGTGTAGLLDKKLDLRLLLQIRAQYVGKIGPLRDIVTQISDKHGFVQLPLTVSGTLDSPVYELDKRWLAKVAAKTAQKPLEKADKRVIPQLPLSQKGKKDLRDNLQKLTE